ARQAAVAELRGCVDLREELAVLGEDVQAGLDAEALTAWGTAAALVPATTLWRTVAAGLVLLAVVAAGLWPMGGGPLPPPGVAGEGIVARTLGRRIAHVVHSAQHPDRELALFGMLLGRLEREQWTSPLLTALRAALATQGEAASQRIARLHRLIHLLDARKNL